MRSLLAQGSCPERAGSAGPLAQGKRGIGDSELFGTLLPSVAR
jgi:hypothetical protein